MITVKLYGLLRIESGIRDQHMQAETMKDVLRSLSDHGISHTELNNCVLLVNGIPASKRSKLKDGDTVVLMSPVAGG